MADEISYNKPRRRKCGGTCSCVSSKEETSLDTSLDPFVLLKRVRSGLKGVNECAETSANEISFLWVDVSPKGIAQPDDAPAGARSLGLDEWLNVVDEAAGYGVNWLCLTMRTALTSFPDVLRVAQWAQDAHGMMVGLHMSASQMSPEEVDLLRALSFDKLTLYVKQNFLGGFQALVEEGLRVTVADPQSYGNRPNCQGPSRMIYVNAQGDLYTCGLVEGNRTYRLGSVFENTFVNILRDPGLPHALPADIHIVDEGCDGCPALIANFSGTP